MAKYNNKNRRQKLEKKPIEKRSENICSLLLRQLYLQEVYILDEILKNKIDYSEVDISLDNGLVLSLPDSAEKSIFNELNDILSSNHIPFEINKENNIVRVYK